MRPHGLVGKVDLCVMRYARRLLRSPAPEACGFIDGARGGNQVDDVAGNSVTMDWERHNGARSGHCGREPDEEVSQP